MLFKKSNLIISKLEETNESLAIINSRLDILEKKILDAAFVDKQDIIDSCLSSKQNILKVLNQLFFENELVKKQLSIEIDIRANIDELNSLKVAVCDIIHKIDDALSNTKKAT